VEVQREEKVLFPDSGITKGHLMEYYLEVAQAILPHLDARPLTLERYPDGIGEDGFYQKTVPDYFPDWIPRVRVPLADGGSQQQVVASNSATLTYLVNQGTTTFHRWPSRRGELLSPDRLVFDLDPSGTDFGPVRRVARSLRNLLERLGLRPFLMSTGSTGVHIVAPIRKGPSFDQAKDFAEKAAEHLARKNPDQVTTHVRKNQRRGRLFLDVARNAHGQTSVAPYSARASSGAPVATPLNWDELDNREVTSRSHTIHSVPRRLTQKADPWKGMGRFATDLRKAVRRLQELEETGEDAPK